MSHDEISLILARLDRLEAKLDRLAQRYERHEAQEDQRLGSLTEFRRFMYGIASGVVIAALAGLGGLVVALIRSLP